MRSPSLFAAARASGEEREVEIELDESLLDEHQRIVVSHLVQASGVLGRIFRLQVWRDNLGYER